jgi:hypothetical protein
MTKTITGLIFGNNRKQCIIEMLTQISYIAQEVQVLKFRKIKNKDLFEYKCKIKID